MSNKRFTDSGRCPAPSPRGMSGVWNNSSWNPKNLRLKRKGKPGGGKCITWFPPKQEPAYA